jgi:hypothetical protein
MVCYGLLLAAAGAMVARDPAWDPVWRIIGAGAVLVGVACLTVPELGGVVHREKDVPLGGHETPDVNRTPKAPKVPRAPKTGRRPRACLTS